MNSYLWRTEASNMTKNAMAAESVQELIRALLDANRSRSLRLPLSEINLSPKNLKKYRLELHFGPQADFPHY